MRWKDPQRTFLSRWKRSRNEPSLEKTLRGLGLGCGWWELGFGAAGAAVNGAGEGEAYPLDGTGVDEEDIVSEQE